MKRNNSILITAILLSFCFFLQPLLGQDKTKEEKEKELKLQQAIDQQKKAMMEQKKVIDIQTDQAMKDLNVKIQKNNELMNVYKSRVRNQGDLEGLDEPYVISPGVEFQDYGRGWFHGSGDSEKTTWDFSKQVKETTFSRQYSFDVEESANTVVMTVMGDCKKGDIRVKIVMPGGKVYSDIVIDEFGNLNWRKSFTISEDENKDKTGEWVFKIEAENATGFFKISLQTY
jgi:hypothetical protein